MYSENGDKSGVIYVNKMNWTEFSVLPRNFDNITKWFIVEDKAEHEAKIKKAVDDKVKRAIASEKAKEKADAERLEARVIAEKLKAKRERPRAKQAK